MCNNIYIYILFYNNYDTNRNEKYRYLFMLKLCVILSHTSSKKLIHTGFVVVAVLQGFTF